MEQPSVQVYSDSDFSDYTTLYSVHCTRVQESSTNLGSHEHGGDTHELQLVPFKGEALGLEVPGESCFAGACWQEHEIGRSRLAGAGGWQEQEVGRSKRLAGIRGWQEQEVGRIRRLAGAGDTRRRLRWSGGRSKRLGCSGGRRGPL